LAKNLPKYLARMSPPTQLCEYITVAQGIYLHSYWTILLGVDNKMICFSNGSCYIDLNTACWTT